MKNGELVRYEPQGSWIKVKRGKEEFLVSRDDNLTRIPILKKQKLGALKRLWLSFCPEFWRKHIRRKSHLKYLGACDVVDPELKRTFGTVGYIWLEKIRIRQLPPIEFNDFDPRMRTRYERRQLLRANIKAAIEENNRTNP